LKGFWKRLNNFLFSGLHAVEEADRQLKDKAESKGHTVETEMLSGYDGVIGTCKHCNGDVGAFITKRSPLTIEFFGNALAMACGAAIEALV
jgi:hypothetical protein